MTELTEQCYLACLMLNPKLWNVAKFITTKQHFSSATGIKLYQIYDNWVSKTPDYETTDVLGVLGFIESEYSDWFKSNKKFIQTGLQSITDADHAEEKFEYFYNELDKGLLNRKTLDLISDLYNKLKTKPRDTTSVLQLALTDLSALSDYAVNQNKIENLAEVSSIIQKKYVQLLDPHYQPSMSGIESLDEILGGWGQHTYHVIAGRSSMGKSSLMACMVRNMIEQQNKKIVVFNLETPNISFINRLAAQTLRINGDSIRNPKRLRQEDRLRYFEFIESIPSRYKDKLFLYDTIYDQDKIFEKIITLYNIHKIDGVVIDLIGYVTNARVSGENRTREIALISQGFLEFRKRYPIFITVLQQLNKAGDTAQSDSNSAQGALRESEDPYQQSDSAILIYPNRIDDGGVKKIDRTSRILTVDKNRDGAVGSTVVQFESEFLTFSERVLGDELN